MRTVRALCFGIAVVVSSGASAQAYPNKPIKMLVGYAPGGSVDVTARTIAERLGNALGQPVLVENRPGHTGNIAADFAAKSAPDGYTLYMGTSINAVSVSLFKSLTYDPVRDLTHISKTVIAPSILVVHPSVPANNVQELVKHIRANPGKVAYATTGPGSSPHLSAELMSTLAGLKMVHVPYKGGSQAITDLLSGQVALSFSNPTSVMPHVQTGRIRALAVTTAKRFSEMPELPTMVEQGFSDFDLAAWYGVMGPAGMPREIVDQLSSEIGKILRTPEIRDLLAKQGLQAAPSTPAELTAELKRDIGFYAKLLKDAGVEPQ